jgi:hypothetical protein
MGDNLKLLQISFEARFHPLTRAVLVVISTGPQKQPSVGSWQLKTAEICNVLVGLCILYASENHFYLVLLQENYDPFFYCVDQIWVHL